MGWIEYAAGHLLKMAVRHWLGYNICAALVVSSEIGVFALPAQPTVWKRGGSQRPSIWSRTRHATEGVMDRSWLYKLGSADHSLNLVCAIAT